MSPVVYFCCPDCALTFLLTTLYLFVLCLLIIGHSIFLFLSFYIFPFILLCSLPVFISLSICSFGATMYLQFQPIHLFWHCFHIIIYMLIWCHYVPTISAVHYTFWHSLTGPLLYTFFAHLSIIISICLVSTINTQGATLQRSYVLKGLQQIARNRCPTVKSLGKWPLLCFHWTGSKKMTDRYISAI